MTQPDNLPIAVVSRRPGAWDATADPAGWPWHALDPLPPFTRADGGAPATWQTAVRLCYDDRALYLHFECDDPDIWGNYTERDDPLYDEEVIEVFFAPGTATPTRYAELEISPNGVLFDALIDNPTGQRADLRADTSWDPAVRASAWRDDAGQRWGALLALPWDEIAPGVVPPNVWRANFFRIERPRGGDPEYSCWSPTISEPADFHRPAYFGTLALG
jgi:hypothetical protein